MAEDIQLPSLVKVKGVFAYYMKRAVIIANGRMEIPQEIDSEIGKSELIIAADGGIHNCRKLGIQPDIIIGDLDSITSEDVKSFRASSVEIIQYPSHKDETDLELALQYATQKRIEEITILGGLGYRWDMTIANLLLLSHPIFNKTKIRLLDGNQELILLRPGDQLTISGNRGDIISLIPLAGDACGITTEGLEYPLKNEKLFFGATRGVSNELIHEHAQITLGDGLLLCVINRRISTDMPEKGN